MKSLEELCAPEGKTMETAAQDANIAQRLPCFSKTIKALAN
jgi:hypothetical protein